MRRTTTTRCCLTLLAGAGVIGVGLGCSQHKPDTAMTSPFPVPMSLAVAPVLNFSGEFSFDPLKAADLLASELSDVENVTVLPVNRVAAYLAVQGKRQIESPAHAVAVAQAVGADAILVAGITEYDPYTPVVGLVLQMYVVSQGQATVSPTVDPVLASRNGRPVALTEHQDPAVPTGQVQMVYSALHEWVVKAVRHYADERSEELSPYGWRQYLKVQTLFLRFCWHDAIERLLQQESRRRATPADGGCLEVSS